MKVFLDQVKGENVVTRCHRRVSGKDGRRLNCLAGLVERLPGLDQFARAFQHQEGRVAFVEVKDDRINSQRPQHLHATDA